VKGGDERHARAVGCEMIYAFIYRAAQRTEQLWRYLTRRHKRRRPLPGDPQRAWQRPAKPVRIALLHLGCRIQDWGKYYRGDRWRISAAASIALWLFTHRTRRRPPPSLRVRLRFRRSFLASCKSAVSNPSVNRSYTDCNNFRAARFRRWRCQRRARSHDVRSCQESAC
jgi:hypothetical protein